MLTVDGSEDDLISLEGLGQIDLSEAGLAAAKVDTSRAEKWKLTLGADTRGVDKAWVLLQR